jgi:hypothetical protein
MSTEATIRKPKLELKNIKIITAMSEDSACFTATLYVDGKRTALCSNHGQGEPTDFDVLNKPKWDEFETYAKSVAKYEIEYAAQIVDALIFEEDMRKQRKRWLRSNVIFRLKGDKKGEWRTCKHQGRRDEAAAAMRKKYGAKIETLIADTKDA